MRFLRQSLTGLFLLGLTLALLVVAGQWLYSSIEARMAREARVPQARERVFAVNVTRAEAREIVPVLTAFGEVQSRRTLDIRAATGGTVVELAPQFVEGGQVRGGEVLARINPADAEAALARAEADLDDAEAEVRDAERAQAIAGDELTAAEEQSDLRSRAFQRQEDLRNRGVGTEAAVETAELAASAARAAVLARRQALAQVEARIDQAANRLSRARIAVAEAERRLADTTIRAAFDGTLSEVAVVQGGLVSANERLARLVDGSALEVAFRVSTAQYALLLDADGALVERPVRVTLDVYGIDLTASGRLVRDSAAVGAGQTGRLLFAQLDAVRGMKPGDFVTVEVEEPAMTDVVRLPASAYDSRGTVLVLGADDRLEEVEVELLRRQGDDVLLTAGAIEGRDVVSARSPLLGAGIKVRPLREGNAATSEAAAEGGAAAQPATEMLELTQERRAALVAFVEANQRMPDEVKTRILAQLQAEKVPAQIVTRLESRMGG